jgi:hypothetical protein
MSKDIEIKDPMVLFANNANDLLAVISYEGTIGAHVPEEIHVDTETKTMSVLFENGQEEKICDLTRENIDVVNQFYAGLKDAKQEVLMGFYQVDNKHKLKNPCYNVPILVM